MENEHKIFSLSNMHIMEYLIRKLESKEKKIIKINEMVKENNSNDFFLKNNEEIINLFNDLEKDLYQAICVVKALITENNALTLSLNKKNYQIKEKNDIDNINIDNLLKENNSIKEIYHFNKTQLSPVKEEIEDSENKSNKLSQVRNIMKDMKENKQKLKNAIENHFINKINEENNIKKKTLNNINILYKKYGNNLNKIFDNNYSYQELERNNYIISEKDLTPRTNHNSYKSLLDSNNKNFVINDYSSF
jgi:hypothetical protein